MELATGKRVAVWTVFLRLLTPLTLNCPYRLVRLNVLAAIPCLNGTAWRNTEEPDTFKRAQMQIKHYYISLRTLTP